MSAVSGGGDICGNGGGSRGNGDRGGGAFTRRSWASACGTAGKGDAGGGSGDRGGGGLVHLVRHMTISWYTEKAGSFGGRGSVHAASQHGPSLNVPNRSRSGVVQGGGAIAFGERSGSHGDGGGACTAGPAGVQG
eukprot:5691691-Prymnesium_polylepis.3